MKSVFFVVAVVLASFSGHVANGQSSISQPDLAALEASEDTLGLLAYAFINDSLEENRFGAVRAFIPTLVKALKRPNSFHYPFEQLHAVSIQYPADSTFRIFTWQLYVDENTYRYYGAIQMNTPDLQLFPLVDRSFTLTEDLEQATLTADQWYGSVYYNLYEVEKGQEKYYLLFGFDGFEFFRKRKIVDVLTFPNGKPQFGAPVFLAEDAQGSVGSKKRLVLEYSAAASVRCNYDPALDLLIFDHLTKAGGEYGEGEVQIPDGTYEGYRLQQGRWIYEEKVFHEVLDEAPRPSPILDDRTRNILGKGGGKN
ncbi:MAG: hypothetical protein DA408_04335 [Bacteroidetes bacterium]|nr:MAG: hypothetical protein C7N36_13205 [Bacteroidota bacterium]PTM14126.1 MAG: hypothetical protein DA408_04335 [Bacteroidota bacterium]